MAIVVYEQDRSVGMVAKQLRGFDSLKQARQIGIRKDGDCRVFFALVPAF